MECSPSDSPRNKLSKTPLKVNEIILETHVIGRWKKYSAPTLCIKPLWETFFRRRHSEWPEQRGVGEDWHWVLIPFPYECSKLAATSLMWLWLWNRNASKITVPIIYASVSRWLLMKDDLSHSLWSCMIRSRRTATRGWHLVGSNTEVDQKREEEEKHQDHRVLGEGRGWRGGKLKTWIGKSDEC